MSSYRNRRIRRSDGIKAAVVVAAVIIVLVSIAVFSGYCEWIIRSLCDSVVVIRSATR